MTSTAKSHYLVARLASWPVWLASAALFVPFAIVFFTSSAPFAIPEVTTICGQSPPDVRFAPSGDEVVGFLRACGPDGRAAYRNLQIADLAYPAIVGLFQASTLALVVTRLGLGRRAGLALVALPLLATAFDYLENVAAWAAIVAAPEPTAVAELFGPASAAKTMTAWVSGLAILAGLAVLAVRWVAGHRAESRAESRAGRNRAGWVHG